MADEPEQVLFVDDEQNIADMYAAYLSDEYQVSTAYDGEVALETLDEADVDVVFLDRRMPGMSGGSVLEEIRERDDDVRVVMLTGVEPDEDVVEMGYDAYVVKPIVRDDLLEVIDEVASRSTPRRVDDDILDALGDPKTRRCCSAIAHGAASAKEIAERTDYSLTTVYRRLNALKQAGIVEAHDTVDPDGDHYKTYSVVTTRISIEIDEGLHVEVDPTDRSEA